MDFNIFVVMLIVEIVIGSIIKGYEVKGIVEVGIIIEVCDVVGMVFGIVIIGIDGKYIVILDLGKVIVN